jgi:hypothetical protein
LFLPNTEHSFDPIARSLHYRHGFAFRPNLGAEQEVVAAIAEVERYSAAADELTPPKG